MTIEVGVAIEDLHVWDATKHVDVGLNAFELRLEIQQISHRHSIFHLQQFKAFSIKSALVLSQGQSQH